MVVPVGNTWHLQLCTHSKPGQNCKTISNNCVTIGVGTSQNCKTTCNDCVTIGVGHDQA